MTEPAAHSPSADHGFTVIELVVACVLSVIVLMAVTMMIIRAFDSSERTQAQLKASNDAKGATLAFVDDIRAARAPDRDAVVDQTELGELLADPSGPAAADVNVHDIHTAAPDTLVVRREALSSSPEIECVAWVREPAPSQDVYRIVTAGSGGLWRTCSGAVLERTKMLRVPRTGDARRPGVTELFTYTVQAPGPDGACAASRTSSPAEVWRVTGATAAFLALADGNDQSRSQTQAAAADLRSRSDEAYRRAIGCG